MNLLKLSTKKNVIIPNEGVNIQMSRHKKQLVATIVTALLVVGTISLVLLSSEPRVMTTSSTTPSQSTCTISLCSGATTSGLSSVTGLHTKVSSGGLELRIDLNATTIVSGGSFAANIALFNPLNDNLSVIPKYPDAANFNNSTIQMWDNYDFLCGGAGPIPYLVSFALLEGHFSAGNISQAPAPLQLAAPVQLPCLSALPPENVVFLPNSSIASFSWPSVPYENEQSATLNVTTVSCIAVPSRSSQCHGGLGLFGYWNTSGPLGFGNNEKYFNYFTPGEYTLAAEDLWNQIAFAYVHVIPGPSPAAAVSAAESPFSNPGEPVIGMTLANFGDIPITSLTATLRFVPPPNSPAGSVSYPFAFNVNSSSPLLPGQTIQDIRTLIGPLFDLGVSYPLTITGTLRNGTEFTYTQQVQFTNSVPVW
jgi:hypothetical protein